MRFVTKYVTRSRLPVLFILDYRKRTITLSVLLVCVFVDVHGSSSLFWPISSHDIYPRRQNLHNHFLVGGLSHCKLFSGHLSLLRFNVYGPLYRSPPPWGHVWPLSVLPVTLFHSLPSYTFYPTHFNHRPPVYYIEY